MGTLFSSREKGQHNSAGISGEDDVAPARRAPQTLLSGEPQQHTLGERDRLAGNVAVVQADASGFTSFADLAAGDEQVYRSFVGGGSKNDDAEERSNGKSSRPGSRNNWTGSSDLGSESASSDAGGMKSSGHINFGSDNFAPNALKHDWNSKEWWMPDNACKECYNCQERFHFFFRRHHCRLCGLIFCYRCSSNFVPARDFGLVSNSRLRACDDCASFSSGVRSPIGGQYSKKEGGTFNASDSKSRSLWRAGIKSSNRKQSSNNPLKQQVRGNKDVLSDGSGNRVGTRNLARARNVARVDTQGVQARYDGQNYQEPIDNLLFNDLDDENCDASDAENSDERDDNKQGYQRSMAVGLHSARLDSPTEKSGLTPSTKARDGDDGRTQANYKVQRKRSFSDSKKPGALPRLYTHVKVSSRDGSQNSPSSKAGTVAGGQFTLYSDTQLLGRENRGRSSIFDDSSSKGRTTPRRRNTTDESTLQLKLDEEFKDESLHDTMNRKSNSYLEKVDILSPVLEAAAASGLLPFDSLSLAQKENAPGMVAGNKTHNMGTESGRIIIGEGDNIGALDSSALSSMHLRLFRLSSSQFLRQEIKDALLPSIKLLKEFSTLTKDSYSSDSKDNGMTNGAAQIQTSKVNKSPCLDLQILVRKVRSLVRQAMRVAVVPGYEHTPMPSVESVLGDKSGKTVSSASLCYDVSQYVRVMAVPGGNMLRDSKFIHGVVFPKNVAHRSMRRSIENPRILLIASGLEWRQNTGGGIVSMETVRDQERKYVEIMVSKVAAVQPSIVISTGVVSALAMQMLVKLGVTCLRNVDPDIVRRLAHFSGATILASARVLSHFRDDPDQVIGTCSSFKVLMHSGQPYTYFEARPDEQMNLVNRVTARFAHEEAFASVGQDIDDPIDGSTGIYGRRQNMIGSVGTVLVRTGESEDLISFHLSTLIRRLVRASIVTSYSLGLEAAYLRDMHGMLEVVGSPNKGPEASSNISSLERVAPNELASAFATLASQPRRAQTVPAKKGDGKSSNLASAWIARPLIISEPLNPYLSMPIIAETVAKASAEISNPTTQLDTALDTIMAANMKAKRRMSLIGKEGIEDESVDTDKVLSNIGISESGTDKDHITDAKNFDAFGRSQNLLFASCWRHPDEDRQCVPPVVKGIRFYSPNDPPLGLWMRQQCFNRTLGCQSKTKKCKRSAMKHRLTYTRPEGQLSITTEVMQPEYMQLLGTLLTDIRGDPLNTLASNVDGVGDPIASWDTSSSVLYTWAFCKICDAIVTPVRPLTEATLALSFGRFLETWFFNDSLRCRDPACGHRVHRDHIRFFGRGDLAACFEFDQIRVFSVSIPGVKSDNDLTPSAANARQQQNRLLETQRKLEIATKGIATPAADASRMRPQMAPAEGWHVESLLNEKNTTSSSTHDILPEVKTEIHFICEATEIIFQAFQERMRGFLLERMIRSCLHQGGGRGTPNALMRRGQEIYAMLRAEWYECWQSMCEEQTAFAKLIGVGNVNTTRGELLWVSQGVTSIELYSLRRRLVQMVDRWNEMMVALYTMVVREAFGGKWVPFETLDKLIEAGFGQALDLDGNAGQKRRLSRSGSFVDVDPGSVVRSTTHASHEVPLKSRSSSSAASSNIRNNADLDFNGYLDEVTAVIAKTSADLGDGRETCDNEEAGSRKHTVEHESNITIDRASTTEDFKSIGSDGASVTKDTATLHGVYNTMQITAAKQSQANLHVQASNSNSTKQTLEADKGSRPQPVVRSDTESRNGRQRSPSWSDMHALVPGVQRASTIDASAYKMGKDPRAERKRLLNSGPLAHYAYAGLLDGILDDKMGHSDNVVDGLFPAIAMSSEPSATRNLSTSDVAVSTRNLIRVNAETSQMPNSSLSGNSIGANTNLANKSFSSTNSTRSKSNIDVTSIYASTSSVARDSVINGGLLSWADPRAAALAVPLDAFPELSRCHLRLPEGLHGIVIPVTWPDNPASVVAKALSTRNYRDGLRDAIETTRAAKQEILEARTKEESANGESQDSSEVSPAPSNMSNEPVNVSSGETSQSSVGGDSSISTATKTEVNSDSGNPGSLFSHAERMTPLGLSELLVTAVKSDLTISFSDDECDFQCTVPCAANFYALRCAYCCKSQNMNKTQSGLKYDASVASSLFFTEVDSASYLSSVTHRVFEESYIQALCQASMWNAKGGKSGATFCRSSDGRFVIKRIRKTEYDMFMSSAKHYFGYLREALYEDMPTMLVKILGIHAIKVSKLIMRFNLESAICYRRRGLTFVHLFPFSFCLPFF